MKLKYGMNVPNVYKHMGVPFKIVYNEERLPKIMLFKKRNKTTKVYFHEGLVHDITISKEKRVNI